MKRPFRSACRVVSVPGACAVLMLGASCRSLPPVAVQETRTAPPAQAGRLADTSRAVLAGRPDYLPSAFLLLEENREALAWRLALIDHAVSSIDLKYFIWEGDESGRLLLSRVLQAAGRGVRVRMLVDDLALAGSDETIAMLSSLPRMEIRIYNPARERGLGSWI